MVKNPPSMQGIWVQSLVCELRSHMPWGNKAHRPQLEEPACCNKDPAGTAKKKKKIPIFAAGLILPVSQKQKLNLRQVQ